MGLRGVNTRSGCGGHLLLGAVPSVARLPGGHRPLEGCNPPVHLHNLLLRIVPAVVGDAGGHRALERRDAGVHLDDLPLRLVPFRLLPAGPRDGALRRLPLLFLANGLRLVFAGGEKLRPLGRRHPGEQGDCRQSSAASERFVTAKRLKMAIVGAPMSCGAIAASAIAASTSESSPVRPWAASQPARSWSAVHVTWGLAAPSIALAGEEPRRQRAHCEDHHGDRG